MGLHFIEEGMRLSRANCHDVIMWERIHPGLRYMCDSQYLCPTHHLCPQSLVWWSEVHNTHQDRRHSGRVWSA